MTLWKLLNNIPSAGDDVYDLDQRERIVEAVLEISMRYLIPFIFPLSLLAQPSVQVNNLAALDSRRPISNEVVYVRGYSTPKDWGDPKPFYTVYGTPSVTNAVNRVVGTNVYYQHAWKDGDVAVFGVFPSASDVSTSLNAAIAYGASNGIPVNLRIVGDYAVTSPVLIPNNATFTMANGATLVRKFRSDVAGFSVPNEATVVNSGTTNWQTLGELIIVNSNITLTGISCRTDETNYMGGHIVMQGVSDLILDRINVGRSYRYWAVHIAASNWVANLPKVRNGGEDSSYVYQDGIHITGGRYGRIIGPDVVSGDDSIAFGQHGMPIRDVVVTGGNLFSTHAQGLRGYIGYDYATNLIERIGIYNVTVNSGTRNGVMQTGTASTNVSRPFRNWSIDGVLAVSKQSGTNPVAFDAGLIVRNFDGLTLKNVSVDFSIEPNLLLLDCDNTTVENCTFGGTGWTIYNQSARIERSSNVQFLRNNILNSNTNSAYGVYVLNSSGVLFGGNTFDTAFSSVSLAGTNSGTITFKHNKFKATNSLQKALVVNQLPTNLVFMLNEIEAAATPAFPSIRYATVTVTNTPVAGNSIAINFNSRAFSTSLTSTTFPPAASISDAVSNIVAALAAHPEPWVSVVQTASDKFVLSSMPGSELYCSTIGGWADVAFSNSSGIVPDNYVIDMNFGWPNPNTDRHVRADNFGPHVRFVQTGALATNAIYSTSGRLRLKNENTGLFFASWDPSSSVFYTLGDSTAQTSPRPGVIQGEGATGTNVATGPLTLRPGAPTGTSTPPNITMQLYVQGTNENAVAQTAFTGLQLSSTIGTNLVGEAGKSALTVGYWTGSFWSTAKLWRTNIGGVNYWIDP